MISFERITKKSPSLRGVATQRMHKGTTGKQNFIALRVRSLYRVETLTLDASVVLAVVMGSSFDCIFIHTDCRISQC